MFDFKFYKWEKELKDKPFLRQPFGDKWEVYTWGEVGQMARKLASGLKSLGLRERADIASLIVRTFVKSIKITPSKAATVMFSKPVAADKTVKAKIILDRRINCFAGK